jgi:hypothetical protein
MFRNLQAISPAASEISPIREIPPFLRIPDCARARSSAIRHENLCATPVLTPGLDRMVCREGEDDAAGSTVTADSFRKVCPMSKRELLLGRTAQGMPLAELLAPVEARHAPLPGLMQVCMASRWQRLRCGI